MTDTNKLANPAPLGLMGFGMTTVLLNIHNAGFYEMNAAILMMGGLLRWNSPNSGRYPRVQKKAILSE